MIDVDEFKLINEKYGHLAGDQTLQALGKLMTGIFFKKDILSRMGGDEFAVFITKASAKELISDKVECLKRRFQQSGRNLGVCRNLSITAGADFVQRKDTFESIYYRADCAMRSGKRNDKGTLSFYYASMKFDVSEAETEKRYSFFGSDMESIVRHLEETESENFSGSGGGWREYYTFLLTYHFYQQQPVPYHDIGRGEKGYGHDYRADCPRIS